LSGYVLIVDDEPSMREVLDAGLARRGYRTLTCPAASDALEVLATSELDVVVADLNMRAMNGLELCERIVTNHPDVPVIMLTGFGSLESAIGAIRVGAYDFITKPVEVDVLAMALDRAIQHRLLRREVKRLRRSAEGAAGLGELIGDSHAMAEVRGLLTRVADSDATLVLTGETGTGKEVAARAVHRAGRRSKGPFVAINCAAMPEALLESELFGHVRGAFTDARAAREGLFQQASRGTLFLDEIGDLPLGLQPKLLRALQERSVRPVGGDSEIAVDVRIVVATNRDLESAVAEGRFREDLFFRVNVIHVELPPLRTRGGDVLLLAQHFVRHFAARTGKPVLGLSHQVAERLTAYPWPGNVRELGNCMERAVALARYEQVTVDDLAERVRGYRPSHVLVASEDPSELVSLEEVERRYIVRVMQAVGENKTRAAQILGLDRKTLYRKLERHNGAASREGK
jgi:two-component system response regulator HydG